MAATDLHVAGLTAVLLDIEGTTTPIAFVHDVLFPFARAHLRGYLDAHGGSAALDDLVTTLAREHAQDAAAGAEPPAWHDAKPAARLDSADAYARWLMDRDRKSPALKELQGRIWEAGYRAGRLQGQIFPDVAPAIRRWRAAGLDVAIYSSGSVLAQQLLFGSTAEGDLNPLLTAFFDTAVGAKTDRDSYARIAKALGRAASEILFLSDAETELRAARTAGLQVRLAVRPGNAPPTGGFEFERVRSLDQLV